MMDIPGTPADEVGDFPAGTVLIARGVRDLRDLTMGRQYTALYGREPGIFPDRPYVTVLNDFGKQAPYHASRFVIAELAA